MNINVFPNDICEAIDLLKIFYKKDLLKMALTEEKEFEIASHYYAGVFIRNNWFLWWHESDGNIEDKPALVEYFNQRGIFDANDMSRIILLGLHRTICKKQLNINQLISLCKDFWKSKGFMDGCPPN